MHDMHICSLHSASPKRESEEYCPLVEWKLIANVAQHCGKRLKLASFDLTNFKGRALLVNEELHTFSVGHFQPELHREKEERERGKLMSYYKRGFGMRRSN